MLRPGTLNFAHKYAESQMGSSPLSGSFRCYLGSWHLRPTASSNLAGGRAERRPQSWSPRILRREPAGQYPLCVFLGCAFSARTQRTWEPGASLSLLSLCPRLRWFSPSVWRSNGIMVFETADFPHPCPGWICPVTIFVGKVERPRAQQRSLPQARHQFQRHCVLRTLLRPGDGRTPL